MKLMNTAQLSTIGIHKQSSNMTIHDIIFILSKYSNKYPLLLLQRREEKVHIQEALPRIRCTQKILHHVQVAVSICSKKKKPAQFVHQEQFHVIRH